MFDQNPCSVAFLFNVSQRAHISSNWLFSFNYFQVIFRLFWFQHLYLVINGECNFRYLEDFDRESFIFYSPEGADFQNAADFTRQCCYLTCLIISLSRKALSWSIWTVHIISFSDEEIKFSLSLVFFFKIPITIDTFDFRASPTHLQAGDATNYIPIGQYCIFNFCEIKKHEFSDCPIHTKYHISCFISLTGQ